MLLPRLGQPAALDRCHSMTIKPERTDGGVDAASAKERQTRQREPPCHTAALDASA